MTLEDLVQAHLDPRKGNGEGEYFVCCPFCGDDSYKMGINVITGKAHCFRAACEWKTSDKRYLFRALAKELQITETLDKKKQQKVVVLKKDHTKITLPNEYEALWTNVTDSIGRKALGYLHSRGVTYEQIRKHRLGFCAAGEYAWRIVFPVVMNKKLVSFTSRDFSGTSPLRYKNAPGSKFYYNVPTVKRKRAVLVEGPIDALAVERAIDYADSIGRLGAGFKADQLRLMLNYDEIIVWPDPDRGGCELAITIAKSLTNRGRLVSIVMPEDDDVDPGKLGESEAGIVEMRQKLRNRCRWNDDVRLKLRSFAAFSFSVRKN